MMDGADVVDSSWRLKDSPTLCAVVGSHIDFVNGLKGEEWGDLKGLCGHACRHISRIVYFIFRLPEMLLLADAVGCHGVSLAARINW